MLSELCADLVQIRGQPKLRESIRFNPSACSCVYGFREYCIEQGEREKTGV